MKKNRSIMIIIFALLALMLVTGCQNVANSDSPAGDISDQILEEELLDSYPVKLMYFLGSSSNYLDDYSVPTWNGIHNVIEASLENALEDAFGYFYDIHSTIGEISPYTSSADSIGNLTTEEYRILKSSLDALDFTKDDTFYNFTTSYDEEKDIIDITLATSLVSNFTPPSVYTLEEIEFVDDDGDRISDSSLPTWNYFYNFLRTDVETALNNAYDSNDYTFYSVFSLIDIDRDKEEISVEKFDALLNDLDTLSFENGNFVYTFSAQYSFLDSKITVSINTNSKDGREIRTFFATQYSTTNSGTSIPKNVIVNSVLVKETNNLKVYLKDGQIMQDKSINYITDNFDALYPTLINTYGTHSDVDGNDKIIILLYDINKDTTGGYIAGFFKPSDLEKRSDYRDPRSNEAEILYVESQVEGDIHNIFATVVHEFQHLINTNMNSIQKDEDSDLWLNEALSESSEILIFDEITLTDGTDVPPMMPLHRAVIYADPVDQDELGFHDLIMLGNYFYTWNDDVSVYADYATASLFMYWIYLNGREKITEIATGSNRGTYKAVLGALDKTDWDTVLFEWLEANENPSSGYENGSVGYINAADGSLEGYKIDQFLSSKVYIGESGSVKLYPGDAVLTKSEINKNDTNISKTTISSGSDTVHITLNKDTRQTSLWEYVTLPATTSYILPRRMGETLPLQLPKDDYRIIHVSPYSQTAIKKGF